MLPLSLLWLCLTALHARAQSESSSPTTTTSSREPERTNESTGIGTDTRSFVTLTADIPASFTGSDYTYVSYDSSQSTYVAQTITFVSGDNSSATGSQSRVTTSTSVTLTQLTGEPSTASSSNATSSTSTTSSVRPVNTVPCNNHPEFCERQYSNITEVAAHNAAFVVKNNAASNQMLSIVDQLNDGVRMLTGETQLVNNTIYNCHTSCDLLNAGPWQDELEILASWLDDHPYDVVTVLIVNSDTVGVGNYTAPIQNSGISKYLYTPEYVPQHRDQWPTLGEMILKNQRAVFFIDYEANQAEVPYILNEFTHIFETPFSPTNQSFPCDKQRPPEDWTTTEQANETFMYLANHNLNTAISLSALGFGSGDDAVLIPNTAEINHTNSDGSAYGELGAMSNNCTELWNRPPNFLLVDYYNLGNFPGSVFQVAARANGVQYTRDCCGVNTNAATHVKLDVAALAAAAVAIVVMMW